MYTNFQKFGVNIIIFNDFERRLMLTKAAFI